MSPPGRHTGSEVPRPYQNELLEYAKATNAIVYLDTGSGKTLIAVLLVKHKLEDLRAHSKITVFLAPTIPLVSQQAEVFARHGLKVGTYAGDMRLVSWDFDKWQKEQREKDVLVMTPDVLVHTLAHAYLSLERDVGLLVFDEVHHGRGDHPYSCIMQDFCHALAPSSRPHILGLTASPNTPGDLEKTFRCQLVTASNRNEVECIVPVSSTREEIYQDGLVSSTMQQCLELMERVVGLLAAGEAYEMLAERLLRRRAFEQSTQMSIGDSHLEDLEELEEDLDRSVSEFTIDLARSSGEVGRLLRQIRGLQYCLQELGAWAAGVVWTKDVLALQHDIPEDITDQLAWVYNEGMTSSDLGEARESAERLMTVHKNKIIQESTRFDLDDSLQDAFCKICLEPSVPQSSSDSGDQDGRESLVTLVMKVGLISVFDILVRLLIRNTEKQHELKAGFRQVINEDVFSRTSGLWQEPFGEDLMSCVDLEELQSHLLEFEPQSGNGSRVQSDLVSVKVQQVIHNLLEKLSTTEQDGTYLLASLQHDAATTSGATSTVEDSGVMAGTASWAGIIFVERKVAALALNELMRTLPGISAHLKSSMFIGNTGRAGGSLLTMDHKAQGGVMEKFHSGEYNLLVATNVGSEGMDFRQCQYVVCVDAPKDATTWVQCRGRARQWNSEFVVMVTQADRVRMAKLKQDVEIMMEVATELSKNNRVHLMTLAKADLQELEVGVLTESTNQVETKHRLYIPQTGASVPHRLAPQFLLEYCNQLPGVDRFTLLQPYYINTREDGLYFSQVFLPNNAPLQRCKGSASKRKALAKQKAALRALKKLVDMNELDEYLRPVWRVQEAKAMQEVRLGAQRPFDSVWSLRSGLSYPGYSLSGMPAGESNSTMDTPTSSTSVEGVPGMVEMWLYGYKIQRRRVPCGAHSEFDTHLNVLDPPAQSPHEPYWHPFGILLPEAVPEPPLFRLWMLEGSQAVASLKLMYRCYLTPCELMLMRKTHQLLTTHLFVKKMKGLEANAPVWSEVKHFTDLVKGETRPASVQESSCADLLKGLSLEPLLVPIELGAVPSSSNTLLTSGKTPLYSSVPSCTLSQAVSWPVVTALSQGPQEVAKLAGQWITDCQALQTILTDSVVLTTYSNAIYNVDHVCPELHVDSSWPGQKSKLDNAGCQRQLSTYREYYKIWWNIHDLVHGQPLVKVFPGRGFKRLNAVAPELINKGQKRQLAEMDEDEDVEEKEEEQEVGAEPKKPGRRLTGDVYLIPQLCCVYPLRKHLWRALYVTPSLLYRTESAIQAMIYRDKVIPPGLSPDAVPSVEAFLYCMTSRQCREPFNLERYEMLGDTVLKFLSTVYLYLKYPEGHEGLLTIKKKHIVNNDALAKCAEAKGLLGSLRVMALDKLNYLVEDSMKPFPLVTTSVQRKAAADMVESTIGIFYESGGLHAACALCEHLGVLEEGTTDMLQNMEEHLPPCSQQSQRGHKGKYPYAAEVEKIIDYKFTRRPDLLPQALRHCSWPQGPCYQRLEFLGDAIVDLLVTEDIFRRHRDYHQGHLTEARRDVVSNLNMAQSVVPLGLHQYIQMTSYQLRKHMVEFVAKLQQQEVVPADKPASVTSLCSECSPPPEQRQSSPGDEIGRGEVERGPNACADGDATNENGGAVAARGSDDTQTLSPEGAPKVLADIVESLVAAVWLDSGQDLEQTWRLCRRLIKYTP